MNSYEPLDLDLCLDTLVSCLEQLDHQYEIYTDQALRFSERFAQLGAELKQFLPILITVTQDKRCTSTTIRWSRVIPTGKAGGKKGFLLKPIRKGRTTYRYPASVFTFLEPDLRARVQRYEDDLALLRTALAGNRSSHRHISNHLKRLQRLGSQSSDSVSH